MRERTKDGLQTFLLVLPWVATLLIFWIYPLIYAAYISFTQYTSLTNNAEFIGFSNYISIFSDSAFYQALKNTLIFTFGTVPITTAASLVLASVLNSKFTRFREFFRAAYFLPSATSLVVISLIFTNFYGNGGYLNLLLKMIGMPYPENGWLQTTGTALPAIMAMDVWISTGYYVVLFLAGMQTIPTDLYDAADIAGATAWQKFFRITLPMIRPTLLFVVVVNTIKSFQVFIEIFVMTKGGPLGSTTTLVYQIYNNAFEKMDGMGYAAALAYVLFVILIIFSALQFKLLSSKNS
jgi:multiple sugar transport system permease protein